MDFREKLEKIVNRQDFTSFEAEELMEDILFGNLTSPQISSVLTALRMKEESPKEILGFINVMRKHMVKVKTRKSTIDTCGTGGDGKGTFNISTAAALVVAAAGVSVAKHGNRNASSLCGSADVLEELGVAINLTNVQAEKMLDKIGFTFLYAPLYHPAMKNVVPVRRELKIRTVFNFLGPFVSPAGVRRQIIGVPGINLAHKLSQVAIHLDYEHLLIIAGSDGLDEISLSAQTSLFEVKGRKTKEITVDPKNFGIEKALSEEIKGGDAKENAKIIKDIFGRVKSAARDIVILNSAAALYVAGKTKTISDGAWLAAETIDSGKARELLEKVVNYRYEN
ncbi:anthranilate phosphoribosyltransferase [Patescibacteria group bacterium]|nr:anthranilate phosphoribosyltransferase [Patescibacteria group bacterium]MCL5797213.1 anthranilate phosphoribosyltransferase [Patescibacteria group bacterium]